MKVVCLYSRRCGRSGKKVFYCGTTEERGAVKSTWHYRDTGRYKEAGGRGRSPARRPGAMDLPLHSQFRTPEPLIGSTPPVYTNN